MDKASDAARVIDKVDDIKDGTKVVVRPTSKEGIPTLEFQFKAPYKIRY